MLSNEFDYYQIVCAPTFKVLESDHGLYRGQTLQTEKYSETSGDFQKHGLGVYIYAKSTNPLKPKVYEGSFINDEKDGHGFEQFVSGATYTGGYKRGKAEGKGVYHWPDGEIYEGEWRNGNKHGYGVWRGKHGDSYIGQWVDGKAQGYGVHTWANGDKYEGEWHKNLRHGSGSDFFKNGDTYVGSYYNGKPHGPGQYKWANGSIFVGMFQNGLKHGQGKWRRRAANSGLGNYYEGGYKNDKKHGVGYFEWESGNSYAGHYKDDERSGYGVMRWTDGSEYFGLWENGIQSGLGIMTYPNEPSRAGFFKDNVLVRPLRQIYEVEEYRSQLTEECMNKLEDYFLKKNYFRPVLTSLNEEEQESETNRRLRESIDSEAHEMLSPFFPNGASQQNLLDRKDTLNTHQISQEFTDQLPQQEFTDHKLNEKILMSGPPTEDSDSEFAKTSSQMVTAKNSILKRMTGLIGSSTYLPNQPHLHDANDASENQEGQRSKFKQRDDDQKRYHGSNNVTLTTNQYTVLHQHQ